MSSVIKRAICSESDGKLIKVTERGLTGLIDFSIKRNKDAIHQYLQNSQTNNLPVHVHEQCRKWFNKKRRINAEKSQTETKKTRKSVQLFNWKLNCFLCGSPCSHDRKNPSRKNWHLASTYEIRQNILDNCKTRLENNEDDEWGFQVQSRITDCIDFIAAEARYHHNCRLHFQTSRSQAESTDSSTKQKGRPQNEELMDFFQNACEWLEAEAEVITMRKFRDKVIECAGREDVYDTRYMKTLLKDKYGGHIFFLNKVGSDTLIYFYDMANFIINQKFKERKESVEDESVRIIQAAANLIKAEIREKEYDTSMYPTCEEINSDWIPESLRVFLGIFTSSRLRQESIGQCIVKSSAPKKIPPILFALGVEMDHLYGSKC